MYLNRLDNYSREALTPEGLCNLIQLEYQPEILSSCTDIGKYFLLHPYIKELPLSVSELTQLLFSKLDDELTHLFLTDWNCISMHTEKLPWYCKFTGNLSGFQGI
jgi:hypothetical protein